MKRAQPRTIKQFTIIGAMFLTAIGAGLGLNVVLHYLGFNLFKTLFPLLQELEQVAVSATAIFLNNLFVGLVLVGGALLVGRFILTILFVNGSLIGFVAGYFVVLGGISFSQFIVATAPHAIFELSGLLGFACLAVNCAERSVGWQWAAGLGSVAALNLLIGAYVEMHLTLILHQLAL